MLWYASGWFAPRSSMRVLTTQMGFVQAPVSRPSQLLDTYHNWPCHDVPDLRRLMRRRTRPMRDTRHGRAVLASDPSSCDRTRSKGPNQASFQAYWAIIPYIALVYHPHLEQHGGRCGRSRRAVRQLGCSLKGGQGYLCATMKAGTYVGGDS